MDTWQGCLLQVWKAHGELKFFMLDLYIKQRDGIMDSKIKEIIEQAVEVVLNRSGDVDTEDGSFATTDADAIIRLELAISAAFSLDSDDVNQSEAWKIQRQLASLYKNEMSDEFVGFDCSADKTDDIEECGNKGCGFNVNGKCTAKGAECFGYIDPEWK